MVHTCILCKASNRTADASISFHRFPTDTEKRYKWLQAINRNKVAQCARLCSNHFQTTDFQDTISGLRRSLKSTAIPSVLTHCNGSNTAECNEGQYHIKIQQNTSKEQSSTIKTEDCMKYNYAANNTCNSLKRKSTENEEIDVPFKHIRYMKDVKVHEVAKHPDKAAMILEIALKTIVEQQKKIQQLQTERNKQNKRLHTLTTLNKHLHDNNLSDIDDISTQAYIVSCTKYANIYDHDFYLHSAFEHLNKSYVDDIVAYIARFIVFKILKLISCDICKQQLYGITCQSKLQGLKNRATLTNASADVATLCKLAEITFRENISILTEKNILHKLLVNTIRKIPNNIFDNTSHLFDQNPLSDHRLQLIKLILNKYFKSRCTHYENSKCENSERVISKLTKLTLFKNQ